MIEMFERAVKRWAVIIPDPKLRRFLNLATDIGELPEPFKSTILNELPIIIADQRMDDYVNHPYKLRILERFTVGVE